MNTRAGDYFRTSQIYSELSTRPSPKAPTLCSLSSCIKSLYTVLQKTNISLTNHRIFGWLEHQHNAQEVIRVLSLHQKEVHFKTSFSLAVLSKTTKAEFLESGALQAQLQETRDLFHGVEWVKGKKEPLMALESYQRGPEFVHLRYPAVGFGPQELIRTSIICSRWPPTLSHGMFHMSPLPPAISPQTNLSDFMNKSVVTSQVCTHPILIHTRIHRSDLANNMWSNQYLLMLPKMAISLLVVVAKQLNKLSLQ